MIVEGRFAKRVLVVEDDLDFAALMTATLQGLGYTSQVAYDAEHALSVMQATPPDAITLDIQMSGKSGLMFYRQMKNNPAWCDIPVIVVTGLTNEDPEWAGFIQSFLEVAHLPAPQAYLTKPLDRDRLRNVLEEAVSCQGIRSTKQPQCKQAGHAAGHNPKGS